MMSPRILQFLIIVISFYVAVSAIDCARDDGDHYVGNCDLEFGDRRPSASELYSSKDPEKKMNDFNQHLDPYQSNDKFKIPAERHHVIPFNTLRAFYNKLVQRIGVKPPAKQKNQNHDTKKLEIFFDEILKSSKEFYMNHCPSWENVAQDKKLSKISNLQKFIKGMKMETLLNDRNTTGRSGGYEDFIPYFSWLPGNLFIGPDHEHRTDDPGEKFEVKAGTIIGQTEFTFLKNAYEQMVKYIANPADETINFSMLSNSLNSILKRHQIYAFKKSDWNIDAKKQRYSIA